MKIPTYAIFIFGVVGVSVMGIAFATTNTDDTISDFSGERVNINTDPNTPIIELRDTDGDGNVPYIDFVNDNVADHDARIILINDDLLRFADTNIEITNGFFRSDNDGEQVTYNGDPVNARIELRDLDGDGGFPYIDFSNDVSINFDGRIILQGDDILEIQGADLKLQTGRNIISDGDICIGQCP